MKNANIFKLLSRNKENNFWLAVLYYRSQDILRFDSHNLSLSIRPGTIPYLIDQEACEKSLLEIKQLLIFFSNLGNAISNNALGSFPKVVPKGEYIHKRSELARNVSQNLTVQWKSAITQLTGFDLTTETSNAIVPTSGEYPGVANFYRVMTFAHQGPFKRTLTYYRHGRIDTVQKRDELREIITGRYLVLSMLNLKRMPMENRYYYAQQGLLKKTVAVHLNFQANFTLWLGDRMHAVTGEKECYEANRGAWAAIGEWVLKDVRSFFTCLREQQLLDRDYYGRLMKMDLEKIRDVLWMMPELDEDHQQECNNLFMAIVLFFNLQDGYQATYKKRAGQFLQLFVLMHLLNVTCSLNCKSGLDRTGCLSAVMSSFHQLVLTSHSEMWKWFYFSLNYQNLLKTMYRMDAQEPFFPKLPCPINITFTPELFFESSTSIMSDFQSAFLMNLLAISSKIPIYSTGLYGLKYENNYLVAQYLPPQLQYPGGTLQLINISKFNTISLHPNFKPLLTGLSAGRYT